ncbi:MAG: SMP-30/gluconolactonase/LRE family protein [Planctomycetota bacterium]|jgi:hypothetical protein
MRIPACVLLSLAACCSAALAAEAPPKFATKPKATKVADGSAAGAKVKITFSVDRETDVAVFIEDGKGKVIRHLAAGVLGKSPPKPLKPGLSQSITWDGKADYGKPAGSGPFKVRVALGLGAKFDREVIRDPQKLGLVGGIAVGPEGSVHVFASFGAAIPNYHGKKLMSFDRTGKYKRTVCPPPSAADAQGWTALGAVPVQLDGRPSPALLGLPQRRLTGFFPGTQTALATTPGGEILVLQDGRIGALKPDGSAAWNRYLGPGLVPGCGSGRSGGLAVSADGKRVYVAGLLRGKGKKAVRLAAVYRTPLPTRGPAEVLFGESDKPGNDGSHLGADPRGLALDGKGHLLIADHLNDRVVVVSEKTGKSVGSFAVKRPHC